MKRVLGLLLSLTVLAGAFGIAAPTVSAAALNTCTGNKGGNGIHRYIDRNVDEASNLARDYDTARSHGTFKEVSAVITLESLWPCDGSYGASYVWPANIIFNNTGGTFLQLGVIWTYGGSPQWARAAAYNNAYTEVLSGGPPIVIGHRYKFSISEGLLGTWWEEIKDLNTGSIGNGGWSQQGPSGVATQVYYDFEAEDTGANLGAWGSTAPQWRMTSMERTYTDGYSSTVTDIDHNAAGTYKGECWQMIYDEYYPTMVDHDYCRQESLTYSGDTFSIYSTD